MRSGLAALIGADERFKVCGAFSTTKEAVSQVDATSERLPDVIIAVLKEGSSLETDELVRTDEGMITLSPAIVALLPAWDQESAISLLRSGAASVLPINATGDEIMAALEASFAGLVVLHRDTLELLGSERTPREPNHEAFDRDQLAESLTTRELQILAMMAEGLANKEIAWQLQISDHTVKFHVSSILGKLGASSRTEAVTLGLRRGLITL